MDDFVNHLEKKSGVSQAAVVDTFYLLPNVPIPVVFFCLAGNATDLSQRDIVVVLLVLQSFEKQMKPTHVSKLFYQSCEDS